MSLPIGSISEVPFTSSIQQGLWGQVYLDHTEERLGKILCARTCLCCKNDRGKPKY